MMLTGTISILIIEDDLELNQALKRTLRAQGHLVNSVGSLNAARVALSVLVPDVVVLDLELPDGNGTALFPVLLRNDYAGTRVIALTDNPADHEHIYMDYDVANVLMKPVSVRGLAMLINHLIEPDVLDVLARRSSYRGAPEYAMRAVPMLANVL